MTHGAFDASQLSLLLRLQTWMSSSFPIGAYTCSHGMETAIYDGRLNSPDSCLEWIKTILSDGSGWNDAVILNEAYRIAKDAHSVNIGAIRELNELALALQAGEERFHETTVLGTSFLSAARAWPETQTVPWENLGYDLSLPVVIGALGGLHAIPLQNLLASAIQSTSSNLVWVATRLVPLGQNQSLWLIAELETTCIQITRRALSATLDDLGGCALLADIASIHHETLPSRVCRT